MGLILGRRNPVPGRWFQWVCMDWDNVPSSECMDLDIVLSSECVWTWTRSLPVSVWTETLSRPVNVWTGTTSRPVRVRAPLHSSDWHDGQDHLLAAMSMRAITEYLTHKAFVSQLSNCGLSPCSEFNKWIWRACFLLTWDWDYHALAHNPSSCVCLSALKLIPNTCSDVVLPQRI